MLVFVILVAVRELAHNVHAVLFAEAATHQKRFKYRFSGFLIYPIRP